MFVRGAKTTSFGNFVNLGARCRRSRPSTRSLDEMDLATLQAEFEELVRGSGAPTQKRTFFDDVPLLDVTDAPILTGYERAYAASLAHCDVRSLLDLEAKQPPTPKATIGMSMLSISPPADGDSLVKDVVASPTFEATISPELPSKKFALPMDVASFTQ